MWLQVFFWVVGFVVFIISVGCILGAAEDDNFGVALLALVVAIVLATTGIARAIEAYPDDAPKCEEVINERPA